MNLSNTDALIGVIQLDIFCGHLTACVAGCVFVLAAAHQTLVAGNISPCRTVSPTRRKVQCVGLLALGELAAWVAYGMSLILGTAYAWLPVINEI